MHGAPRTRARREAATRSRRHTCARARQRGRELRTSPSRARLRLPGTARPASCPALAPHRRLPLAAPPGGREPAAYMKGRGGRGARPLRARWAQLALLSPVAAAARGSVPRRASAAGRPSARAGAPTPPRARGAEYRPGPLRSDVHSLPPPPARSPWPAGRPRTATAIGRSSSGTRRRRSCWAAPGAAGVSAGLGAAGTAARSATPPSPAAGLRRGRGLRAYRGGAGVQVGRGGVGRPWRGRLVLGAPSPASPRRAGGLPAAPRFFRCILPRRKDAELPAPRREKAAVRFRAREDGEAASCGDARPRGAPHK